MTLIVKTDVLDTDGNSFASVEFVDDFATLRQRANWSGTDAVKEAALIAATDYIVLRFGTRWTDEVLALTEIPEDLKRATAEYAIRAIAGDLLPDPKVDESGHTVVMVSKATGPLKKEWQVTSQGTPSLFRNYPQADIYLATLLVPLTGSSSTYR